MGMSVGASRSTVDQVLGKIASSGNKMAVETGM